MSLKIFHIIFIAISIVTAIGFGLWCLNAYGVQAGTVYLVGAVLSFLIGAALVIYGIWFLRKLKNVSST